MDKAQSIPAEYMPEPEPETVPDAWACPCCGEARMDFLANEDGHITCVSCGREYDIE